MKNIKFISYSGKYPTLCHGTLAVEINGKKVTFGWTELYTAVGEEKADYPRFWCSGGSVLFDNDWNEEVPGYCDWELSVSEYDKKYYPPEIWKILLDILKVMNENVEGGCCGGCI